MVKLKAKSSTALKTWALILTKKEPPLNDIKGGSQRNNNHVLLPQNQSSMTLAVQI